MGPRTSRANLALAIAAMVIVSLVAGACDTPSATDTTEATTTTQTSPTTTRSTESENPDTTEPAGPGQVVAEAVDSLVEIGTYAFEAKILLSVQDQPAEVELEGWVDGSDRELEMKIDGRTVTTRVIDGVATVERDGETVEVPLTEAGSAPSILILKSIEDAAFETATTVTGELAASELESSDYEVAGAAAITIRLTSEGQLAGYSMEADDGSWTVDVKFEDIGENPKL